jgi:hypothetical protein
MRRSCLLSLLLAVALTLLSAGCSTRPDEQIAQAEEGLKAAQEQHAEFFAPEDFSAARQAWDEANSKLKQEKYGDATLLLIKAHTRFHKAAEIAKGKKEDTTRQIKGIHEAATKRLQTLKDAMEKDKARISAAKKKTFEETTKDIEQKLSQVTTKLEGGEFQEAKFLADTALRTVWETQKELEATLGGKKIG